jgi:hypothetical protein
MTALESRKQLLLAESELNRALLEQEWAALAGEAAQFARQAATLASVVSTVVTLAGGLAAARPPAAQPAAAKTSWWRTLLKAALLAGSLWAELRRSGNTPSPTPPE